jgi:hypothetical protein
MKGVSNPDPAAGRTRTISSRQWVTKQRSRLPC